MPWNFREGTWAERKADGPRREVHDRRALNGQRAEGVLERCCQRRADGPSRPRRSPPGEASGSGGSASAADPLPEPLAADGTRKPPAQIYAVVSSEVAPQGVYLSRQRLEAAFQPSVSFGALPGVPGDLRGYQRSELAEAVEYFFARHPRCGQVTVYR